MPDVLAAALAAGALAGTVVDATLFPLDTIKTRLQSGAAAAGTPLTLATVYRGFGAAVVASAPCGSGAKKPLQYFS